MVVNWLRNAVKTNRSFLSHRGRRRVSRPRAATHAFERLDQRLALSATSGSDNSALNNIDHIVVIYQENWSFDALYGSFPGANGIANASPTSLTQVDRLNGQPLSGEATYNPAVKYKNGADPTLQNPPPALTNTSTGAIDTRFLTDPNNLNSPTKVDTLLPYDLSQILPASGTTGDIVHRFYQEQQQIDGGNQKQYVTMSDNPGLVMSHFDATNLPEGLLAQQYTMDDNFFHAAYGGSFLNHQFLVAAAAPVYPNAPTSMDPQLAANGQLALDANGKIVHDGNITPTTAQQAGSPFSQNYAVNTIFSKNLAPDFIGNDTSASLLPSQNDSNPSDPNRSYIPTIGDTLDAANVSWKYYAGGWDNALVGSPSNPANNGTTPPVDPADPNFQWHHQPLAYYDNFAPWITDPNNPTGPMIRNPLSAAHLQDENNLFQDLSNGNLPAVSFIKPIGANNEHPGYTDLLHGQQHVADIVHAIQNSTAWANTAIIITYDENGGRWDHVAPPTANGLWGDGTRVPAIVISPYAKRGYVDHTQHDTLSILSTMEQRFNVAPLNQLDGQASTLANDFQATPRVSLGDAYVQPDAGTPGQFALIVQGTEGNDTIHVTTDNGEIRVQIDGKGVHFDQYFANPISRLEVYSQGGNDQIAIDPSVTVPAFVFTGGGNDKVEAGRGPSVLVGGGGNDHLNGGSAPNILIGGAGKTGLAAGSAGDILIGGSTHFDANIEALEALLAEWSNTSKTYGTKVAELTGQVAGGANGSTFLNTSTVQGNGKRDTLTGGAGMDLFFASLSGPKKSRDDIEGFKAGETLIGI